MYPILICDNQPIIAQGIAAIISGIPWLYLVGITTRASECIKILTSKKIGLVILNDNLPDATGVEMCNAISNGYPEAKVLVISSQKRCESVKRMLDCGASGYMLNNVMLDEIVLGIKSVLNGETYLSHELEMLMKKESVEHKALTPREADLLRLICDGYTNTEIAHKLHLGIETVNSYRKNLLQKLNARNTAMLVRLAMENRLV